MNRRLTSAAAALPLALGIAANVAAPRSSLPENGSALVTKNAVLWSGPPPNGTRLGQLAEGETVSVLSADYYHVQKHDGTTGWIYSRDLTAVSATAPGGPTPTEGGSEAGANPECPAVGTHKVNGQAKPYAGNSDAGLRNIAKRHIPAVGKPTALTLADFAALQSDIDSAFNDASTTKTAFAPTRDALRDLTLSSGSIGEGDLVQLAAYVTIVRPQGPESVNCGGLDGTDIHINVGDHGASEFAGVVVEMIPQLPRPVGWDPATLNRIHAATLPVLVVGSLTYDNEHLVNQDSKHSKSGQPKRISLWEIHPITEFYVCTSLSGCDPAQHDQWMTLADWAAAHPQ